MASFKDAARRQSAPVESDRQLFERVRAGDAAAFEVLFRSYAAPLCVFARGYVHTPDVAEELVQDLFCWLWDHRSENAVPASVKAYLFAALRNRAINHLRRERLSLDFKASTAKQGSVTPLHRDADADLMAEDLSAALAVAIRTLPTRCREVFSLVRDDHLTYVEVADVLGISPKTVEIHMSRALASLREQLAVWLAR
ncbi:MAG: RNA polymerase sigma-70 factor [bacterium]